jgi:hypothetical protein
MVSLFKIYVCFLFLFVYTFFIFLFFSNIHIQALSYEGFVTYWQNVKEQFFDPFVRWMEESPTSRERLPLIVVHHRFVWDIPNFRAMITSLLQTQVCVCVCPHICD